MSSDTYALDQEGVELPQGDYRLPIARGGEQQFACILRNRSGIDAGCIDMAVRDITHLCDAEQQDVVNTAYLIYETYAKQVNKLQNVRTTLIG